MVRRNRMKKTRGTETEGVRPGRVYLEISVCPGALSVLEFRRESAVPYRGTPPGVGIEQFERNVQRYGVSLEPIFSSPCG